MDIEEEKSEQSGGSSKYILIVFLILLIGAVALLSYYLYECQHKEEDCDSCCKTCKCGGGSGGNGGGGGGGGNGGGGGGNGGGGGGPPPPSWKFEGQGLSSISADQSSWGENHVNLTPDIDTLDKAQAWVQSQGGISLNYPAIVCMPGDKCEGGAQWYLFWSKRPFVGTMPYQPNGGWTSWSLKK